MKTLMITLSLVFSSVAFGMSEHLGAEGICHKISDKREVKASSKDKQSKEKSTKEAKK
jgi:hypothetical protein